MELTFNIIYTPGTVNYLRLFVFSLLKWSDCSFRLIANGCSVPEEELLESLCQKSSRLSFLALPSDSMMKHGQALSFLQSIEQSNYFCFMDSDIWATGDFMSELVPHLSYCTGVFTGSPVWCKVEERTLPDTCLVMGGRFNRTKTGMCLGSTYLAIYDNDLLTSVRQSSNLGFEQSWWTDLPAQHQDWLAEMELKKVQYDTGKLLNLFLQAQGEQLVWVESLSLQHIGGISWFLAQKRRSRRERILWKSQWLLRGTAQRFKQLVMQADLSAGAWTSSRQAARTSKKTTGYYMQVWHALFEDRPLPPAPRLGDPELEGRIELVAKEMVTTYEEFKEHLV